MTYTTYENSVQDGDPLYRILFVQGSTEYRYTSSPTIIADSGGEWEAVAFRPSEISQTNEMKKDSVKVVMSRESTISQTFLGGVPEQITSVIIYRQHASDITEDFVIAFKGRVSAVSIDSAVSITLECESIFTSMRRPGLRARYQKTCRHTLYGRGCNLNDYDYVVAGTVNAASGFTATIEGNSSIDDGYYTGGMIETTEGFMRFITKHSGNTLTMIRPFQALEDEVNSSAGFASVLLYPGCDRTITTCLAKFNNIDNFGGQPWIPSINPFGNNVSGSIT